MSDIHAKKVLILDFGSQYTQLIARRVREARVYCELHTSKMSEEAARAFAPSGIILSGGPDTVTLDETLRAPAWVFEMGCPVLGICYGLQTMAKQLGGKVESSAHREFGYASVEIVEEGGIFKDLADEIIDSKSTLDVWMSHGDKVTQIPAGFKILAKTASAPVAAMADEAKGFYGIQFHPEVTHTRSGMGIFQNFLHKICKIESQWTPSNIIEDCIAHVREQVGQEEVLLGLSGGVDSSVVAALLHKAIGSQLTCVFVDNGLLRLNEAKEVMDTFAEYGKVKVIHVDASERFLTALAGVSDPEAKRKVIGKVFIDVFEEEAAKIKNMAWLAQGTIYPDVIESAGSSGHAKVIKSHHNVGGLPDYMKLKLLEPIKELFKDEVRKIGIELGLPYDRVYRHPFPGPGLGVRILGEVKVEYTTILKQADAIFMEVLRKYDLYNSVNQAFAVFLPVKSVGVMGDERKYDYVIALRAVETTDFMTARWAHLPYAVLEEASNRIINEVKGISRVTYDISGKPPATIEWE